MKVTFSNKKRPDFSQMRRNALQQAEPVKAQVLGVPTEAAPVVLPVSTVAAPVAQQEVIAQEDTDDIFEDSELCHDESEEIEE